jgi:hypothetical protein
VERAALEQLQQALWRFQVDVPPALTERIYCAESNQAPFVWAFRSLVDVQSLDLRRRADWYRAYAQPEQLWQYHEQRLYERYPFDRDTIVDVLILQGRAVCRDPRFGCWLGAASVATENPSAIPPAQWRNNPMHDFVDGIFLVEVSPDTQLYRVDLQIITALWERARPAGAERLRSAAADEAELETSMRDRLAVYLDRR